MAEYKRQHYVPQFYLRNFSEGGRARVFNLSNEEVYPPTSTRNLCQEDYFYGGEEQEQAISAMEGQVSTALRDVIQSYSIESLSDWETRSKFDLFLTHTHARTKSARESSHELMQELLEMRTEVGVEAGEVGEEALQSVRDGRVTLEGPAHPQMQLASTYGPYHLLDLHRVLLYNGTETEFITSDHPVYLDNPRFKNEINQGTVGLCSAGLQIICPLSVDLAVLLFDPEVYRVDANSSNVVVIDDHDAIDDLNRLQLINALESCFFKSEGMASQVRQYYSQVREVRPDKFVQREETTVYDRETGEEKEVEMTYDTKIDFSPELPFVSSNPTAEFRPVRDEEWLKAVREMKETELQQIEEELENSPE